MSRSAVLRFNSLWLLLAAALVLRAAIPTGWMPVSGEDGIRVLLCDGHSAVRTIAIAVPGGGDHAKSSHHAGGADGEHEALRDPCPFGLALGKIFNLPGNAALIPPPATIAIEAATVWAAAHLTARRNIRPPVRAPPAFG